MFKKLLILQNTLNTQFDKWAILPQLNIVKLQFVVRQISVQPLGRKSAQSLALIRLPSLYPYALYSIFSAAAVPSPLQALVCVDL